jgi:hypothetical protein
LSGNETPAERIERKKTEAELRKQQAEREALWCSLIAHFNGILLIAAQLDLGYKPNFRKEK